MDSTCVLEDANDYTLDVTAVQSIVCSTIAIIGCKNSFFDRTMTEWQLSILDYVGDVYVWLNYLKLNSYRSTLERFYCIYRSVYIYMWHMALWV